MPFLKTHTYGLRTTTTDSYIIRTLAISAASVYSALSQLISNLPKFHCPCCLSRPDGLKLCLSRRRGAVVQTRPLGFHTCGSRVGCRRRRPGFYLIHRMTHPPRTQFYGSPRDFQVILQRPMWFDDKWRNSDATQSAGWFLSRGKPAPVVILSHGYGSNRSELLTLAFELWKAGYHILLYDMRGHGESPVKWSGSAVRERRSLSAIKFLRTKKTDGGQELIDGRVGLYGVDMGGYISLSLPPRTRQSKRLPSILFIRTWDASSITGSRLLSAQTARPQTVWLTPIGQAISPTSRCSSTCCAAKTRRRPPNRSPRLTLPSSS